MRGRVALARKDGGQATAELSGRGAVDGSVLFDGGSRVGVVFLGRQLQGALVREDVGQATAERSGWGAGDDHWQPRQRASNGTGPPGHRGLREVGANGGGTGDEERYGAEDEGGLHRVVSCVVSVR